MENNWKKIFETLPISTVGELILVLQKYPLDMEVRIARLEDDPDNKDGEMIPIYDRHVYVQSLSPKASKFQNSFDREILSIQTW